MIIRVPVDDSSHPIFDYLEGVGYRWGSWRSLKDSELRRFISGKIKSIYINSTLQVSWSPVKVEGNHPVVIATPAAVMKFGARELTSLWANSNLARKLNFFNVKEMGNLYDT